MSRSFVNLPAWFPVAKAASVLRSLRREFILISDPRGGVGVASLADLSRAPQDKTAQWCATGANGFVTPLDSAQEAWRKMVELKTERLPVKVGDLIVGVVTSSSLRTALGGGRTGRSSSTPARRRTTRHPQGGVPDLDPPPPGKALAA
ncbi:MAG: CBS domain-containing protein [Myxococcales bacterium]